MNASTFIYKFDPGSAPLGVLLLHGIDGDEEELVTFGREIAPGAPLISPRGKVLENGKPRFFRRLRPDMFDEEDVRRRAHELADFVGEARTAHGLADLVAVGFCDGATIAAAVLLLRPDIFTAAILIRATQPLRKQPMTDLSGKPVLMLSGASDLIVHEENSARLAQMLITAGADVERDVVPAGHEITPRDASLAKSFIESLSQGGGALAAATPP
jgi:phospholipase/carboxylesterase